ncbi:GAF domain-containing protein [Geothermobacter ehrlichii]|uniref:GAF domain-containing protein n=1 Tax=Geothermobacter ehrlichii TaxID=213224 RepID=A0A5D3WNQ1_9BACT|nr:GAF domain-containing protein [Geothermobacter ehrlichii]TYO98989.1 GAF domain-containing protein [Geothermobacter ehrlichii]
MGSDSENGKAISNSLRRELRSCSELDDKVEKAVPVLSRRFGVATDEVALFLLDERKTVLHFLWPLRLKQVGFIPYSSLDSLAARTAREGRVFLNNTFASVHHASFFEKIRLKDGITERPKPIQKIISVPMVADGDIRGVIQISRKGDEGDELPDFSTADAELLVELASIIGAEL